MSKFQDQFPVVAFKKSVKDRLRRTLVCIPLASKLKPQSYLSKTKEAELKLPITRMKETEGLN